MRLAKLLQSALALHSDELLRLSCPINPAYAWTPVHRPRGPAHLGLAHLGLGHPGLGHPGLGHLGLGHLGGGHLGGDHRRDHGHGQTMRQKSTTPLFRECLPWR